ncbi:MAG: sigma-54-dependent transcriptional regulator [Planctomycetota bacterium]
MSEPTPLRILVVDDEESVRFFLQRGLTKAGYHVDEASSGGEAIEKLGALPYDVVLTDLVMPEVSGLDVLAAAQEMDGGAVVILMTAHGSVDNAIDALRLGACDYLAKPFEMKELLVTVERGLDRRSMERENRKLRFLVNKVEQEPEAPEGLLASRREWEKRYLADLLRQTRGNVTKAAELAKISRPNLHKKLKQLGISPADFKRS